MFYSIGPECLLRHRHCSEKARVFGPEKLISGLSNDWRQGVYQTRAPLRVGSKSYSETLDKPVKKLFMEKHSSLFRAASATNTKEVL
jgi:hypothetical protein